MQVPAEMQQQADEFEELFRQIPEEERTTFILGLAAWLQSKLALLTE